MLADSGRPADSDLPAAACPKQELDEALSIDQVGLGARMVVRKGDGLVARARRPHAPAQ